MNEIFVEPVIKWGILLKLFIISFFSVYFLLLEYILSPNFSAGGCQSFGGKSLEPGEKMFLTVHDLPDKSQVPLRHYI